MLSLYAQTFMIATRTDQPQHPDAVPGSIRGRTSPAGPAPADLPRHDLPYPRLSACPGRHDPL
jgi:hypothetical protein